MSKLVLTLLKVQRETQAILTTLSKYHETLKGIDIEWIFVLSYEGFVDNYTG